MLILLLLGLIVALSNVIVEIVAVSLVVRYLIHRFARRALQANYLYFRDSTTLLVTMAIMSAGHVAQASIWAILFQSLGEFDSFGNAIYHSTMNFTTLGYGDIVMNFSARQEWTGCALEKWAAAESRIDLVL